MICSFMLLYTNTSPVTIIEMLKNLVIFILRVSPQAYFALSVAQNIPLHIIQVTQLLVC